MLPYHHLPESLIRELSRIRQFPKCSISESIQKCKDWDKQHPEWLSDILHKKSDNSDHLELLVYGFSQNYIQSDSPFLTRPYEDLQQYLKMCEIFSGIHPYPPLRSYTLLNFDSNMVPVLVNNGIPEVELIQWPRQQIQEVFSTGYLPPALARRISRRKVLKEIEQQTPPRFSSEFYQACTRVYGSLHHFIDISEPSIWEKLIMKIPDCSAMQLSRITSILFPLVFPKRFEDLPILWQCRLYVLSHIPFWFDLEGETLNFEEVSPIQPSISQNPWKKVMH